MTCTYRRYKFPDWDYCAEPGMIVTSRETAGFPVLCQRHAPDLGLALTGDADAVPRVDTGAAPTRPDEPGGADSRAVPAPFG